jgi:hypothetical protein
MGRNRDRKPKTKIEGGWVLAGPLDEADRHVAFADEENADPVFCKIALTRAPARRIFL